MKEYGEVLENVNLKDYSTFKVGGIAKYLIKVFDEESLIKLIKYLKTNNLKYFILGNGSNVIFDDSYFDGVIIKLDYFDKITFDGNIVSAESGVKLPFLVQKTLNEGFTSLAFASMIPGTVGGSIVGNAGCYHHELMEYLLDVTVMDHNGKVKTLTKNDISFGYRYTSLKNHYLVLNCRFILEKGDVDQAREELKMQNLKRKETQPLDKFNVGSIFRNPENMAAGKLIEDLGLKGYMIGGAKVSEKHANFIVNEDNATFEDIIKLIDYIKAEVKTNYNIDLVLEPTIVKWNEI